jgi:hypothetical protein
MSERLVYRVSQGQQVVVWVAIACFLVVAGGVLVIGDKPWGNRIGASVMALLAAPLLHRFSIHLCLEITPEQVQVATPLRSFGFPTTDLSHASGGRLLTLHLTSGATVRVLAVTNTNVTVGRRRRGRTERAADEINAFLTATRASSGL